MLRVFGLLLLAIAASAAMAQGPAPDAQLKACAGGDAFDEMIAACTAAIDSGKLGAPALALAHANRGQCYLEMHENERAILDFNRAIELDANAIGAYFQRGRAHAELGRKQEAAADYHKVLQLQPGEKWATEGLRRLEAPPPG